MKLDRLHILAVYAVGLFFIITPLSEVGVAVVPPAPGATAWRFAAVTLFSRALLTPLLGALLIVGIAHFAAHRAVLLTMGGLLFVGALSLLISSAFFVLDALETRIQLSPDQHRSYDLANAQVFLKLASAAVTAALMAAAGFRSARAISTSRRTVGRASRLIRNAEEPSLESVAAPRQG